MGYKFSYDIAKAILEINSAFRSVCDNKLDGYNQWGAKQDLYRLKWIIDDILKKCPTFVIEKEWLREQEKLKVINILKDKT